MQRQVHLKEVKRLIHESNNVVTDERKMCLKIKDANSVFNNLFHFGLTVKSSIFIRKCDERLIGSGFSFNVVIKSNWRKQPTFREDTPGFPAQ